MMGMPFNLGSVEAAALASELPELPQELQCLVAQADGERFQAVAMDQRQLADRSISDLLELAHAALQLGFVEQADELLLKADARHPSWQLVPDRWGLWPLHTSADQQATEDDQQREHCLWLRDLYLYWRHQPAIALWRAWLPAVKQRWQAANDWQEQALMGLLLNRLDELGAQLEPALQQLVGEEQVAADPKAALLFWQPISHRCPKWAYARLKAADLCLQAGELQACGKHLQGADQTQRQAPWLHDIEARLAMAQQQPQAALRCWDEAMQLARATGDSELVEMFRQRQREAEWDAKRMPESLQLSDYSAEAALDAFSGKIEAWADRAGIALPVGGLADSDPDPEAWARRLDEAHGRLALIIA